MTLLFPPTPASAQPLAHPHPDKYVHHSGTQEAADFSKRPQFTSRSSPHRDSCPILGNKSPQGVGTAPHQSEQGYGIGSTRRQSKRGYGHDNLIRPGRRHLQRIGARAQGNVTGACVIPDIAEEYSTVRQGNIHVRDVGR